MVWVIAGAVLQVLGLACAAIGLGQTWAHNPKPESLAWRIFGPPIDYVAVKILRRTRPANVQPPAGTINITGGTVSVQVTAALNTDAPLPDQIAQAKRETDAAGLRAQQALTSAERTDRRVTDLEALLRAEIARVEADLETARKAEAADTVPLATIGLAVTALGTVLGLVGSLVTAAG